MIKTRKQTKETVEQSKTIDATEAVFSGEYVCLPHKDTNGPQTLECAFGLKTSDGTYIALSIGNLLNSDQNMKFATGTQLRVYGTFVPIEQISTDMWQKYPVTGILDVKEVTTL